MNQGIEAAEAQFRSYRSWIPPVSVFSFWEWPIDMKLDVKNIEVEEPQCMLQTVQSV